MKDLIVLSNNIDLVLNDISVDLENDVKNYEEDVIAYFDQLDYEKSLE